MSETSWPLQRSNLNSVYQGCSSVLALFRLRERRFKGSRPISMVGASWQCLGFERGESRARDSILWQVPPRNVSARERRVTGSRLNPIL
ncbi:hypothetical protein AVEN_22582-1 [Araneus ventricosus]|uniref:Uncharacterized protein n=1 Tax=Araneus ventricosus TaxID=182803 RepID=A0A4Y2E526_ARAVE|nr:hypothetical protein AVEN_22582-1 [Araneus ventricosus]